MILLGLLIITAAWVMQFLSKSQTLRREFVLGYLLGSAILALDGLMTGMYQVAFLNALVSGIALLTLRNVKK